MIRIGTRIPRDLRHGTRKVLVLAMDDRPLYASPEMEHWGLKQWLALNAVTTTVMTTDATAQWLELDITLPADFTGDPETGFVGSLEIGLPPMRLGLSWSNNLTEWVSGGWIQSPGTSPVTLEDGRQQWRARYTSAPNFYAETLVDLSVTTRRSGKSITGLSVLGEDIALSGFPFAMPADSARFQSALHSAGYAEATVTSVTAPLTCTVLNHTPAGSQMLVVTMEGTNVVDVSWMGSTIPLSYPFSLPTQRASLQSALRSSGYSGAVVMLYADSWTMVLPDRLAFGKTRHIFLTVTPEDPFPVWDFYGNYTGENAGNIVTGEFYNLRAPNGSPLSESDKGFARLGFIPI